MKVKFINSIKKNIDILIYITCKLNKKDIENKLNLKLPKTLFNNFSGDYNDIKKQYFNDKVVIIGGLGKNTECSTENIRKITANCIKSIDNPSNKNLCIFLKTTNKMLDIDAEVISTILSLYSFDKYKNNVGNNLPKNLLFYSKSKKYEEQVNKSIIIGNTINMVRDLINEPGNKLNPDTYTKIIKQIASKKKYSLEILNENQIKKLGMGGIISICQGSKYKPRLVILKYRPNKKNKKNIVFVGKGVTFDSGGINIKYNDFSDMKSDMTGSAIVLGIIDCISKLGIKKNVIGLLPIVENMPDANSIRPGDVVKMYNKKTVEIINTDAEGRMIMADALSYSKKFNPELVIDIATLTGQAESITNHMASIVMGNNNKIINDLINIGEEQYEKLINLSIWKDFINSTKSDIADFKNMGSDRNGGTIFAGAFLSNFVPKDVNWLHIDLGGDILFKDHFYYKKGATGISTRLFINYLLQ